MDYGTLQTTIAAYLHRTDLTAIIPSFILFGQIRISKDIKDTVFLRTAADITVTDGVGTLPTGFLGFDSVRTEVSGVSRPVQNQSLLQNAATLKSASLAEASQAEYYYALKTATTIEVVPLNSITLNTVYRSNLSALSGDTDTDAILTRFPNAYLYAALIEATPYIVNDKRMGTWGGLYETAVEGIRQVSRTIEFTDNTVQIKSTGMMRP